MSKSPINFLGQESVQESAIQQLQNYFNNNIVGGGSMGGVIGNIGNNIANSTDNPNQANQSAMFNSVPSATLNPTVTVSDMSVPTEGMAQDNLGVEPIDIVSNGNNTQNMFTGGFSPQTINSAKGIYGNNVERYRSLRKPLIKL